MAGQEVDRSAVSAAGAAVAGAAPVAFPERVALGVGALLTIAAIVWSFDVPLKLGWPIYTEQFVCAMIGLAVFLAYLRPGAAGRVPATRWALAIAGLAIGLWLTIRYPALQADMLGKPIESILLASLLLVALLDCCRRSAGIALVFVFAFFFLYACYGHLLSGAWQTKEMSLRRLLTYVALDTSGVPGVALIIACTTVIAFMFFGRVLQACGGADFFTDISSALFGRYRGGSGKVEVVASALFGTISGSAVANVMSTGIITIPNMKRAGYKAETAGGIEAVSSTGGQIMPPVMGAAAFLMAENLQVRYIEVAIAALVPALLFYLAVFIQVDYEAARRKIGGLDPASLPRPRAVMRAGWYFLVPFFVLFALMYQWNIGAEEAVLWGVLALAPFAAWFGYGGTRLSWREFFHAVAMTGRDAVEIIIICAVAGGVIGLLNITGLALGLGLSLVNLTQGSLPLLLIAIALICVVLGMGLPTTGVYLLVAMLAAPPLIQLGVDKTAAHMFVFFFGCLSMITPPVAMAAYAAAHIAGTGPMRVALTACRLGWPAFVLPFVFAYSPNLLLAGQPADIVLAVAGAGLACWFGSAAIAGYFVVAIGPARRVLYALLAMALILPLQAVPGARYIVGIACAVAVVLIAFERLRARSS